MNIMLAELGELENICERRSKVKLIETWIVGGVIVFEREGDLD
jgi:hypothetical protein